MGIIYHAEHNGARKKRDLGTTSFEDALRQAAHDVRCRVYDAVSFTLEDGFVITPDEMEDLTISYGGFLSRYTTQENETRDALESIREHKMRERYEAAERQEWLKQASTTMQNMIVSGRLWRPPVVTSWIHLNQVEMTAEQRKLWALIEYNLEGIHAWKFYIEGRDQYLSAQTKEKAEQIMYGLISGLIEML